MKSQENENECFVKEERFSGGPRTVIAEGNSLVVRGQYNINLTEIKGKEKKGRFNAYTS